MGDIEAIAVLQDPVRRRLYEYVIAQGHEVSRNEAAEGTAVQRTLAAFHLDKLVEAGLLDATSRRLTGRSGPGAGRPAKLYRRTAAEHQVSLPPRDYRTVAGLLAEVAETARLDDELRDAARRQGQELRAAERPTTGMTELLTRRGYQPQLEETDEGTVVRMHNCPFHAIAEGFPGLVCGMNLALLEGLLDSDRVRMDPRPGMCCTVVEVSKNKTD